MKFTLKYGKSEGNEAQNEEYPHFAFELQEEYATFATEAENDGFQCKRTVCFYPHKSHTQAYVYI